jgi:hypothetical protein
MERAAGVSSLAYPPGRRGKKGEELGEAATKLILSYRERPDSLRAD